MPGRREMEQKTQPRVGVARYFARQNMYNGKPPAGRQPRLTAFCSIKSVLAKEKSAGEGGGLWCKSTICGLNGHRVNFVMALSLETYGQAI